MTRAELVDEVVRLQQRSAGLAAQVERLSQALRDISGAVTRPEGRHYSVNDELHRVQNLAHSHCFDAIIRRTPPSQAEGEPE